MNRQDLNGIMDFGVIVRSDGHGNVIPAPGDDYIEEVQYVDSTPDGGVEDPIAPSGWRYLKGWTAQYGYRGPIMHPSEFIGGSLAQYILTTAGDYVAVIFDITVDTDEPEQESPGWGILTREA